MVEIAAIAYRAQKKQCPIDQVGKSYTGDIGGMRQALKALYWPTGEMIDAGAESFGCNPWDNPDLVGQPTKCWQAMLDALLEEDNDQG